jgi:SPP1 family predicted phage head-tail adaptor
VTQAAGKLNHRISFLSLTTTKDSNGETVEEFVVARQAWAEFVPSSAREFIASNAVQSKVVGRFTIRSGEVLPDWVILFRGRYYNIEGILPDPVSGLEYITLPVSFNVQATP